MRILEQVCCWSINTLMQCHRCHNKSVVRINCGLLKAFGLFPPWQVSTWIQWQRDNTHVAKYMGAFHLYFVLIRFGV